MRSYSGTETACAPVGRVAALGRLRASVATDTPVQKPERVSHYVSYVGETQQHQRDTHDGVEYRRHLPKHGFGCNVSVSCKTTIAALTIKITILVDH